MPRDGSGTRAQIVAVALRLFVERGYDKTSLREIADEVGVTKAALYYHFRTKDDIVHAVLEDFAGEVGEVAEWLREQPPGPERDAGFVERLTALVEGGGSSAMHFARTNPTVMNRPDFAAAQMQPMLTLLSNLAGPDATAEATVSALLAYVAIALGTTAAEAFPRTGTPEEWRAATRAIALELLARTRA